MRKTQPFTQKTEPDSSSGPLIKPRDQGSLLVLVSSALLMTFCYWWYHGGHRGELIEIDRASPLEARFQVDVNRADWPEIIQLPGLGKTLAQRILAERAKNGPYQTVDDLVRVDGIGPKTLENIRPYLLPIPKDSDWAAVDEKSDGIVQ